MATKIKKESTLWNDMPKTPWKKQDWNVSKLNKKARKKEEEYTIFTIKVNLKHPAKIKGNAKNYYKAISAATIMENHADIQRGVRAAVDEVLSAMCTALVINGLESVNTRRKSK